MCFFLWIFFPLLINLSVSTWYGLNFLIAFMDLITFGGLIWFKKSWFPHLWKLKKINFSQFLLLVQTTVVCNQTFQNPTEPLPCCFFLSPSHESL